MMFKEIRGGKYDFISEQTIRNAIDEVGRRRIVLVEGITDKRIFEILFGEEKFYFIITGACSKVVEYIDGAVKHQEQQLFGIIDRDFCTDEEREEKIQQSRQQLYIHNCYAVENYLIESNLLLELIKDKKAECSIPQNEIDEIILDILKHLVTVMSGNRVLLHYNQKFLPISDKCASVESRLPANMIWDETTVWLRVKAKLAPSLDEQEFMEAEEKYNQWVHDYNLYCGDIIALHKIINGKYFFHHFQEEVKKRHKINNICATGYRFSLARMLKIKNVPRDLKRVSFLS